MILRLVGPGHVAEQLQAWLASTPTDFEICYTLRQGNVQDTPKTPLVKSINSLLYSFGYTADDIVGSNVRSTQYGSFWDDFTPSDDPTNSVTALKDDG